jgi:hypothetical protein
VYAFLAAVAACGVLQVELWPLSGFLLFSQVRTGTHVTWELVAVDDAGAEARVDPAAMGRGFRQTAHALPAIASGPARERQAACGAWLSRLDDVRTVRAYRTVTAQDEPGGPARLVRRDLRFTCDRFER